MNKALDEWDAEMAADEVDRRAGLERFTALVADPAIAPMSELLATFIGLTVGGALTGGGIVEGTGIDRDSALGVPAIEIDRRLPRP